MSTCLRVIGQIAALLVLVAVTACDSDDALLLPPEEPAPIPIRDSAYLRITSLDSSLSADTVVRGFCGPFFGVGNGPRWWLLPDCHTMYLEYSFLVGRREIKVGIHAADSSTSGAVLNFENLMESLSGENPVPIHSSIIVFSPDGNYSNFDIEPWTYDCENPYRDNLAESSQKLIAIRDVVCITREASFGYGIVRYDGYLYNINNKSDSIGPIVIDAQLPFKVN